MPVTPFKAMEFKKNDVITKDQLDQLQNNMQWVYDNSPRGRFVRTDGSMLNNYTVLIGGKARIRKNRKSDTANAKVRFGKAFSSACSPHVTTGIICTFQQRIHCVVNGPRGKNYPDYTGFEINVNVAAGSKKNDKIKQDFWISWQAFGYRRNDMNEF